MKYFSPFSSGQAWLVTGDTSADDSHPLRRVFTLTSEDQSLVEHAFGDLPTNWREPSLDFIQFVDQVHGWLRAGSSLYFTSDGGLDWTQVH